MTSMSSRGLAVPTSWDSNSSIPAWDDNNDMPIEESFDSPVAVKDFCYLPHTALIKRRRPRNVSFADSCLLYPSDRTEEEVQTAWYTKEELALFKKERRDVIKILKKAAFNLSAVDAEKTCLRGFEPYFSIEVNKATKYARELVYTVVFTEQNRQRSVGEFDEEAVRSSSQLASQWALRNALELGSLDAAESYILNSTESKKLLQAVYEGFFPVEIVENSSLLLKTSLCQEIQKTSVCREIKRRFPENLCCERLRR